TCPVGRHSPGLLLPGEDMPPTSMRLPNRIAKGIDRRLAPLFARNPVLSLGYERLSLALSPNVRKRPIVLFQFGRVGSHTIEESLEARLSGTRIHHVHFLTPKG